ncbi:MAG: phosphatase PAP2 family protein [Rubrivivax sp.]|nr:MAG: phosphatase PAP2 family protein [Rubrivivax sp.]
MEESLRDVTALGGFTVLTLIVVVATLAFAFHGKRRQAWLLPIVVVVAQLSNSVLKLIYARPRPDVVAYDSYVYSHSFPSGHSTMAAATFLTLATLIASLEPKRRTKALVYILAAILIVAIGFSRVYLAVHWPTDVLAGWTLGSACAMGGWLALRTLQLRERARSR